MAPLGWPTCGRTHSFSIFQRPLEGFLWEPSTHSMWSQSEDQATLENAPAGHPSWDKWLCSSNNASSIFTSSLPNHRIIYVGSLRLQSLTQHCQVHHWSTALSTTSTEPGNSSRGGDSTTPLANLFQCLTTFSMKAFFLVSNLNLPWYNMMLFLLALSLLHLEKETIPHLATTYFWGVVGTKVSHNYISSSWNTCGWGWALSLLFLRKTCWKDHVGVVARVLRISGEWHWHSVGALLSEFVCGGKAFPQLKKSLLFQLLRSWWLCEKLK